MHGSPHRPLDRKATAAFALAVAILLATAVFVKWRVHSLETATDWVDHTHQVIETLEVVSHRLTDAESAQRAFVLAGDERFRVGFMDAAAQVAPGLARLRALTRDNSEQQRRLDTLGTMAQRRLHELRQAIDERHSLADAERTHAVMDDFDSVSVRMQQAERELLSERALARTQSIEQLALAMNIAPLVALAIALLAVLRVRRASADRFAAESERDEHAQEVAMQAEELGAQNEELIAQGEALQVAMDLAEGANEAKSVFLAQMSHELRTPLNSVIGFANIVRRNPRGALLESEMTYLDRVVENGRHLLRTINSILDLSKIEANHESVELEVVSLQDLAQEVLSSLETQATVAGIMLRVDAPPALASIVTDRDKLRRVLVNLVANAVKFTRQGGTVTIRLEPSSRTPTLPLAIEVQDSGIGIAPSRLTAIFEAFEQGDIGVGREYGGTGLGLSISRALCRLLHFELSVTSTLGVGSVFRVTLATDEPIAAGAGHQPGMRR